MKKTLMLLNRTDYRESFSCVGTFVWNSLPGPLNLNEMSQSLRRFLKKPCNFKIIFILLMSFVVKTKGTLLF